ncbi:DUF937 domain-containing protein [Alcaligenaceae bacterium]|nr:DUF937 domain-containing protein [Alcaligenaceae bacterium]
MGLLDTIVSAMGSSSPQAQAQASLLPALIELVKNYPGGLSGLIEKFQQGGLGDVIASWIGNGQNQSISAGQLQSVLGDGIVNNLAQKSGLDVGAVLSNLSTMLPSLVDQATPQGSLDAPTGLGGSLLGMLGKL